MFAPWQLHPGDIALVRGLRPDRELRQPRAAQDGGTLFGGGRELVALPASWIHCFGPGVHPGEREGILWHRGEEQRGGKEDHGLSPAKKKVTTCSARWSRNWSYSASPIPTM